MRAALTILIVVAFMASLAVADNPLKRFSSTANDGSVDYGTQAPAGPHQPTVTDSPGIIVGTSSYEYQTNGSSGKRIFLDSMGGVHIAWTKGTTLGSRPRYVFYNFMDEEGMWLGETQISQTNGTGFITLTGKTTGEAIAAYHKADPPSNCASAIDLFRGSGIFEEHDLDAGAGYIWPYVSRDINGRLHMIATVNEGPPSRTAYAYSTDEGVTWSGWSLVRNNSNLSMIICSSPVSAKSAIVVADFNADSLFDVFYIESEDGIAWDFNDALDITNYTPDDSLTAWPDVDAVYDYDDVLHIGYIALDLYDAEEIGDAWHWSSTAGNSIIASAREGCPSQSWYYYACIMKINLGVDPSNGNILAIWSEGSHDDVSQAGFANHDLYAAGSDDGGTTWYGKVDLTNSPTPGCAPPDCDHDDWCSLAEKVDGKLHIMYVDDDDAGAAWRPQGVWTMNNVLYLEVDEGDLIPLSVYDNPDLPFDFTLSQNYPNPFNANTLINVSGDFDTGALAIYDITGRLVKDFPIDREHRSITWDGTDISGESVSSGMYFYAVSVDGYGEAGVRKMTLLK